MVGPTHWPTFTFLLSIFLATAQFLPSSGLGVNYGTVANNLPNPADVINLYKKCGIQHVRLFEPNHAILDALRGTKLILRVSFGVKNEDLQALASDSNIAVVWVNTNVVPYVNDVAFEWITLGNEVIPGPLAVYVPQAMTNMYNALATVFGSPQPMKVSTVVATSVLGASYPPSAGAFSEESIGVIRDVTSFLSQYNFPFMINVYPYFSYASNPNGISLAYALFQPNVTNNVVDGDLTYDNLFDAMVDSVHAALEKINAANLTITISETGWPSAGQDPYASKENAETYNTNLVKRVGTPKRPNAQMDVFIFAMFNENQKPEGVEQNWGLFYPTMEPVYPLFQCQP